MFKISTLVYSLKQGFRGLLKNRRFSLAAVSTMTACLFLFGVFYFVLVNLSTLITSTEKTVGITVFFDDGLSEEEILDIGEKITQNPHVSSATYKSAEQTWEEYKKEYLSEELSETFGDDNPLENSASYSVTTTSLDYQAEVADYIKGLKGVRQVNSAKDVTETLQGVNRGVMYGAGALTLVLLAISTFLIRITISMGVSLHRDEISIMKLIGATDYFVRGPFVVEGVIIGIVGAVIPIILLKLLYSRLTVAITRKFVSAFENFKFVPEKTIFMMLAPICLLIGIGVGFIGSEVTLSRELRKIK